MKRFYLKVFFGYAFLMFISGTVLALIHHYVFAWGDYVGSAWVALSLGIAGFCLLFKEAVSLDFEIAAPLGAWLGVIHGFSNDHSVYMGLSLFWVIISLLYGLLYCVGYIGAFPPTSDNKKPAS